MINWNTIKYFTRKEFDDPNHPGSGDLIDGILLMMLDRLRRLTRWPKHPHASVGGCVDIDGSWDHADDSFHLKRMGCMACDFHFESDAPLREQYNYVCRMGFSGIGTYYDWHNIGFHVDRRPIERTQHWTRIDGIYTYLLK